MKKLIIALIVSMMVFCTQLYSQNGNGTGLGNGNGKGKGHNKPDKEQKDKDQKDNGKDKIKDKEKKDKNKEDEKTNNGKGHAYGKDKDSLTGKEFGQKRAADAKSKKEAITNAEANIDKTTKTNDDTKAKIKQAREKLDAKKKAKKINDKEYNKKKKELDDLENQVLELEKQKSAVNEKLNKEKEVKQK